MKNRLSNNPVRYIQCSVYTLQVYPVLGIYPTDISSARYIPYRFIQCSVYTLQIYPMLGIYPTDVTLKKKSSTDPQIKSVHIGYEDQVFKIIYTPHIISDFRFQFIKWHQIVPMFCTSIYFKETKKSEPHYVCFSVCLYVRLKLMNPCTDWLGNSVEPRKYLVLACYRITHKGWDFNDYLKNMTISRLTKKSSILNNVSWWILIWQFTISEYKNRTIVSILESHPLWVFLQVHSIWNILHAKRIEYILEWNLLEKSVKRPFCCTVSILQVYFT